MNISQTTAQQIIAELKTSNDYAHHSIERLTPILGAEEAGVYRSLVGEFMGNSYLNQMRPLLNAFPDVKMPEFSEKQVVSPVMLIQDFYFLIDSALQRYGRLFAEGELDGTFRPGALKETEDAFLNIKNFIQTNQPADP